MNHDVEAASGTYPIWICGNEFVESVFCVGSHPPENEKLKNERTGMPENYMEDWRSKHLKSKRNMLGLFEAIGKYVETFRAEVAEDVKRMEEPAPEAMTMGGAPPPGTDRCDLLVTLNLNVPQSEAVERLRKTGLYGNTDEDVAMRLLDGALRNHLQRGESGMKHQTLASLREQVEQLQIQLAGCSTAAEGFTKDVAKPGDWGWSPSYQDVLKLRRKYDALRKRHESDADWAGAVYIGRRQGRSPATSRKAAKARWAKRGKGKQ